MYYYKARIYSPTIGRFMQTDPIGYEDQFNLYAYVGNDPVNSVDPSGLQSVEYYKEGDPEDSDAKKVEAPDGFALVFAHGNTDGTVANQNGPRTQTMVDGKQIYNDLVAAGYEKGTPIIMIVCNSANGGAPVASDLADRAGATVYAAAGYIYIPTGEVGRGDAQFVMSTRPTKETNVRNSGLLGINRHGMVTGSIKAVVHYPSQNRTSIQRGGMSDTIRISSFRDSATTVKKDTK